MFANSFLSENVEIVKQLDYASGTADRTAAAGVPTAGCEGILFVVHHAAIAGTNSLKIIGSASSNLGTPADIEGTAQSIGSTHDNNVTYVDVKGPFSHAYLGLYIDKDTVNTAAESALAYRYGCRKQPVSQAATVLGEKHHAPIAGTA